MNIGLDENIPVPTLPRLLTMEQVTELTTLKRSALYNLVDAKVLTRIKVLNKTCFEERQVIDWINARIAEGKARAKALG